MFYCKLGTNTEIKGDTYLIFGTCLALTVLYLTVFFFFHLVVLSLIRNENTAKELHKMEIWTLKMFLVGLLIPIFSIAFNIFEEQNFFNIAARPIVFLYFSLIYGYFVLSAPIYNNNHTAPRFEFTKHLCSTGDKCFNTLKYFFCYKVCCQSSTVSRDFDKPLLEKYHVEMCLGNTFCFLCFPRYQYYNFTDWLNATLFCRVYSSVPFYESLESPESSVEWPFIYRTIPVFYTVEKILILLVSKFVVEPERKSVGSPLPFTAAAINIFFLAIIYCFGFYKDTEIAEWVEIINRIGITLLLILGGSSLNAERDENFNESETLQTLMLVLQSFFFLDGSLFCTSLIFFMMFF